MGGKKTKISMEKIARKDSRAVAFSKRRKGLYSKTSELCLLSGAQVAILATPVSSKSNASFYSFGHSSVDNVVSAFLANQRPQENLRQKFWWQDESLAKSEDTKELTDAIDSISSMLHNLRSAAVESREDMKKKKKDDVVIHETHQDQTLNLQSNCASICNIRDDQPANFEGFVKKSGDKDQIAAISDVSNLDGCNQEQDLDLIIDFETNHEGLTMDLVADDVSTNRVSCSGSEDGAMATQSNSDEDNLHRLSGSDEDHIVAISDSSNNNSNPLLLFDQGLDLDQIIDSLTSSEGLSMNFEMDDVSMMIKTNQNMCHHDDSEAVGDGAVRIHSDFLHEDNLHFSDYFSMS